MALKIVLWGSKSPEAQMFPPFHCSLECGIMRMTMNGRLKPDKIKFDFENVPIPDGWLNFYKKYGQVDENTKELVVDTDKLSFTDFLPFAFQVLAESFLKSTTPLQKDETPKEEILTPHNDMDIIKVE